MIRSTCEDFAHMTRSGELRPAHSEDVALVLADEPDGQTGVYWVDQFGDMWPCRTISREAEDSAHHARCVNAWCESARIKGLQVIDNRSRREGRMKPLRYIATGIVAALALAFVLFWLAGLGMHIITDPVSGFARLAVALGVLLIASALMRSR